MADEVKANNALGKPTRWILPCGPTKQYPYFIKYVNEERISLHHLHVFHMDDSLDWQARPLPLDHPFSYEGWMRRNFYAPLDQALTVPEGQRHFPSVYAIDAISQAIADVGGIDTVYGGIGYRGHIAFNEPPRSPWYTITPEMFRNSKTRILSLNEDTLIALSRARRRRLLARRSPDGHHAGDEGSAGCQTHPPDLGHRHLEAGHAARAAVQRDDHRIPGYFRPGSPGRAGGGRPVHRRPAAGARLSMNPLERMHARLAGKPVDRIA